MGFDLSQLRLTHPKLSALVSERLGIVPLRRLMLAQSADSVALSLVGRAVRFSRTQCVELCVLRCAHKCWAVTMLCLAVHGLLCW
jgi:hypothetical protein